MKKEYKAPQIKAQEVKCAASGACGQRYSMGCGELVQQM